MPVLVRLGGFSSASLGPSGTVTQVLLFVLAGEGLDDCLTHLYCRKENLKLCQGKGLNERRIANDKKIWQKAELSLGQQGLVDIWT